MSPTLSPKAVLSNVPSLTTREAEILAYVASGMDNAGISAALNVSEQTVKNTMRTVGIKMNENGGSARVRMALRAHGLPTL